MVFPIDHPEKSGLPRPVRSDQAQALPGPQAKRCAGKKDFIPENFFQTDDFDHDKTIEKIFFPLYITTTFLKSHNRGGSHEKVEAIVACRHLGGF
jgi:hypothetical protein